MTYDPPAAAVRWRCVAAGCCACWAAGQGKVDCAGAVEAGRTHALHPFKDQRSPLCRPSPKTPDRASAGLRQAGAPLSWRTERAYALGRLQARAEVSGSTSEPASGATRDKERACAGRAGTLRRRATAKSAGSQRDTGERCEAIKPRTIATDVENVLLSPPPTRRNDGIMWPMAHPRAGQPALPEDLIDVDAVISAYYDLVPDPAIPTNRWFSAPPDIAGPAWIRRSMMRTSPPRRRPSSSTALPRASPALCISAKTHTHSPTCLDNCHRSTGRK